MTDRGRYENHDGDLCMLCGAHGSDKRNLFVSCLYAIHEVVPEAIDLRAAGTERVGYYLRICKSCRGRFLEGLGRWRAECIALRGTPMDHDGCPEDEP